MRAYELLPSGGGLMSRKKKLYVALLVGAALSSPFMAQAADISWSAAVPGDWSNFLNWTPAVVPGAADNALVTNGGTALITTNDGTVQNVTITSSTVNKSGVTSKINVTDTMQLDSGASAGLY